MSHLRSCHPYNSGQSASHDCPQLSLARSHISRRVRSLVCVGSMGVSFRSSDAGASPPQEGCRARRQYSRAARLAGAIAVAAALPAAPALAALHAEPANALSLPTWAIHISSTVEWGTAMLLFWKYADVTGNQRWKGLTWGMVPLLGGAMAACTYHFFYNPPELDFLVALQAFLTVVGNSTCAWAAYRIYADAQTGGSTEG